jgi:hypothetical protein
MVWQMSASLESLSKTGWRMSASLASPSKPGWQMSASLASLAHFQKMPFWWVLEFAKFAREWPLPRSLNGLFISFQSLLFLAISHLNVDDKGLKIKFMYFCFRKMLRPMSRPTRAKKIPATKSSSVCSRPLLRRIKETNSSRWPFHLLCWCTLSQYCTCIFNVLGLNLFLLHLMVD